MNKKFDLLDEGARAGFRKVLWSFLAAYATVVALAGLLIPTGECSALCDLIPLVMQTFPGARQATERSFDPHFVGAFLSVTLVTAIMLSILACPWLLSRRPVLYVSTKAKMGDLALHLSLLAVAWLFPTFTQSAAYSFGEGRTSALFHIAVSSRLSVVLVFGVFFGLVQLFVFMLAVGTAVAPLRKSNFK
jgi:hypothetical protein